MNNFNRIETVLYGFIYQKYYNKLVTDLSYKTSEFLL